LGREVVLLVLFIVSPILGCTTLPELSSGEIGCPADEVTISDHEMSWRSDTWTAECRGRRFYCTGVPPAEGGVTVSCTEEQTESTGTQHSPSETTGCQHDNQCKGDRVCNAGRCENP